MTLGCAKNGQRGYPVLIYQIYLPHFRLDKDGGTVGDGLDFWLLHSDDATPFGNSSDETFGLGEDICIAADAWLGTNSCNLYFSTTQYIWESLISGEGQQYGGGKRFIERELAQEKGARDRVLSLRSPRPLTSGGGDGTRGRHALRNDRLASSRNARYRPPRPSTRQGQS